MKTPNPDHPIRNTLKHLALAPTMGAALYFGAAPASAAPPVTAGLKLHLDASQLGLNDNDPVPTWTDMSGLGNNATAAGAPIYKTNVLNGQPVVRFDNGSSFTTADLSSQFPSAATVFIATTISNDNAYTLVKANPGVDEWWRWDGNGQSYPGVFRGNRLEGYCAMPNSGSHLFAITSSASAWEMSINGTSQGVAGANYNAGGALVIGNGSSGGGLNGDIAEVLIYDSVLTPAEMEQVGLYLASKYGLTTSLGPPVVSNYSPGDGGNMVNTSNLSLTFSKPIAIGTGDITIKNLNNSLDTRVITLPDLQVTASGAVLTINPDVDLLVGGEYAVQIAAGAIVDFAGILDDETWNFTTIASMPPPPLPPVTDGMVVWLPADGVNPNDTTQVRIDGSDTFVKQWNDLGSLLGSQNASNGTMNDQPLYIASGLNDKPVLRFAQDNDDIGDRLYLGDLGANFPTAGSVYIVSTIDNDGRYNLFGNRGNNDERWVANSWNEAVPGSFRNGRTPFAFSSFPQNGSHVFVLQNSSGGQFQMLIDGASIGTASADYNSGAGSNWTIGNRATSGQQLRGDIAEVIIYNRVLTAGEADQVGAYLATKYGLSTIYGPPTIASSTPPDDSTTAVSADLVLTFNKPIAIGTGTITIKNLTTPGSDMVIDVTDADKVSISGSVLTINPENDLSAGKSYAVQIAPGAITDLALQPFAGISDDTTWNFTAAPLITNTIVVTSSGSTSTYGDSVTFTATIDPVPSGGTVQFLNDGGNLGNPVAVNTSTGLATYSTTTLGAVTHGITAQYSGNFQYAVSTSAEIEQEVLPAELTVKATNLFRQTNTANPDPLPYEITGFKNGENLGSSGVSGTPVLRTDAVLSSPVGNYEITCTEGDLAADNYSFTPVNGTLTVTNLACQLGVLNLGANGGINPATGQPWAQGDTYRLVFVTSGTTPCGSTDIATYNTFVQGLANASTAFPALGNTTWKVVGSTATVDARDNTGTNPNLNGIGEPVLRMDGMFVIANNYADLWDGINFTHAAGQDYLSVHLDENGVVRTDERVRTGSSGNGTASGPLGNSGNVQTGRNFTPDFYNGYGGTGWMQDWGEAAASAGRVYAMSGILTIVSTNPAGYGSWAAANAGGQTPDQDYDNDGVENGIEYFMGETGSSFTAMPGLDGTNTISWAMSAAYQGTYEVQISPDLATWTNVDPRPVPSGGTLSYTLPPGAPGGKRFVRLLVTPAP